MRQGVVAPVSVSRGCMTQAGRETMGVAARRAVVLGTTILLGCAAIIVLSQTGEQTEGPSMLTEETSLAWMHSLQRQKDGMPPDQMFMTAVKSGMLAASDGKHVIDTARPLARASAKLAAKPAAKTQRLEEVEAAPVPEAAAAPVSEAEAEAGPLPEDAPPAEVQEGEEAAVQSPSVEDAQAAEDAQVPPGVLQGQEEIADDAVPEGQDASQGSGGVPPGYRLVTPIQQPAAAPPMNVILQGAPIQVPVRSPGVGLIENAITMPPDAFKGGGWSEETINGLPIPHKVTITVRRQHVEEAPVQNAAPAEEAATDEEAPKQEEETPAEETAAPAVPEAPAEGGEAPAEEQAAPVAPEGEVPAEEQAAPAAPEGEAPGEEQAALAGEVEAPGEEQAAEEGEAPAEEQAAPGEEQAASAEEEAVPAEEQAAPAEEGAVQEPELGEEVGSAEPVLGSAGPYAVGAAEPLVGAARVPEMGQLMPVVGSFCTAGKRQSPINIEFDIMQRVLPLLLWQVTDGTAATLRSVPITVGTELSGRTLLLEGATAIMPIGGVGYSLESINVHVASEHTIASQRFDMEMQFLHSAIVNGVKRSMVISVMGRLAHASAPFIAQLAASLPSEFTTAETTVPLNMADVARQVLGQTELIDPTATNAQSYYQYDGSFTTAPCTEGVTWVVLKNPLPVAEMDLELMSKYLGQPSRALQPLNGRLVLTRALP